MRSLWKVLNFFRFGTPIMEDVAKLAATEREVRSLEAMIKYVASIEDRELAHLVRHQSSNPPDRARSLSNH